MERNEQSIQQKLANEIGISVVKIQRADNNSNDVGFTLDFNDENEAFVKSINNEFQFYKDGILKEGDRLLWINRTNVEKMSRDEVIAVLNDAPHGSNLVVTRSNEKQNKKQRDHHDNKSETDQVKEVQLIPNLLGSEEPYMFGVTYLT